MSTFKRIPAPDVGPDAVAALFAAQYGLATPAQLRTAGVRIEEQRARIDRREWEWISSGVIALRGVPEDWRRLPMAATLASSRVAVTAGTALRLHGVDGFRDHEGLHLVARLGDRPRVPDGFDLWRSRRLTADDVMVRDGVRTTTVATALVHAAPLVEGDLFGQAVDDVLRRDVSPAWVQEVADRWSGHGVPGSGLLTAALAERCEKRLPRSWFERLARRALAQHGIELEHEVPVVDNRRTIARLDLAEVRLKVGVECQSWAWHSTPTARRANAARKRRLTRLGWDITELWWSDLHKMHEVVADVVAAMDRQRKILGLS